MASWCLTEGSGRFGATTSRFQSTTSYSYFFPVGKEAGGLVCFFSFLGGRAGWDIFGVVSQKSFFLH